MRETLERMWNSIKEWFAAMPRGRKIQLGILSVVVIVLAIVAVNLLTRTNWVPLQGTGDQTNTSHIYLALDDLGIPARVENGRIMIPEERIGDARMRLIDMGLIGTSSFNTDLLDGATGFGITGCMTVGLWGSGFGSLGLDGRSAAT